MKLLILLFPFLLYGVTDTSPQRIGTEASAVDDTAHVMTGVTNTHLDKLRYLIKIDPLMTKAGHFYSVWNTNVLKFGDKFHTNVHPEEHITSEATLLGFDCRTLSSNIFGITAGYIHSYFTQAPHADHGTTNGGCLAFYSSVDVEPCYLEFALWGIYQLGRNKRNIQTDTVHTTGIASIPNWQLEPHFEVGINIPRKFGRFTPYTTCDYVHTWQGSYTEHGAGIYNASQANYQFNSLHTEFGFKFHEFWSFNWGLLLVKQKVYASFDRAFAPSSTIFEQGVQQTFISPADHTFTPFFCISAEIAPSIGLESPITLRLDYDGKFSYDRMANKIQLLISKIF